MRKNTTIVAGVAILSALALGACGLGGGNDEKGDNSGGDSQASNNGGDSGDSGDSSGGGGSGSAASGAKPSDEGAGGGSSSGGQDSGSSGGDRGQAGGQGGGQSGGSGGAGMQEVGDVIEGFSGQLDGYLDNYQQNLAAGFGASGVRDVITGLQAGNSYTWDLGSLQGGQTYMILGACDQDCTDVDLFVMDSRGQQIGQDIALDDHPQITLTPGRNERFTVRIQLVNCEVEPCYVAGRVVQRGR